MDDGIHNRISQSVIDKITERIVQEYKPLKIILFGSYAWGTPHRDSDIDLLIVKETKERPIDRCVEVHRMISKLTKFIPMDILVITPVELNKRIDIGDHFVRRIQNQGVTLYVN